MRFSERRWRPTAFQQRLMKVSEVQKHTAVSLYLLPGSVHRWRTPGKRLDYCPAFVLKALRTPVTVRTTPQTQQKIRTSIVAIVEQAGMLAKASVGLDAINLDAR
jgi:hypothetical protein